MLEEISVDLVLLKGKIAGAASSAESIDPPTEPADLVERLLAGSDSAELTEEELVLLSAYLESYLLPLSMAQQGKESTGESAILARLRKLQTIRDFNQNLQAASTPPISSQTTDDNPKKGNSTAEAGEAPMGKMTSTAPAMKKPKRSTERGDGRVKLIAALTKHHQYADGGSLNQDPIGNNELARLADVDRATASAFFKQQFKGHGKYKALCGDAGQLTAALKLLNGDFAAHLLYGGKPPEEAERGEE